MIALGFGSFLVLFLAKWASSQPEMKSPCGVNWTQRCKMKGDLTPVSEARGMRISVRGVKISMRAICQPHHPTYTTGSVSGHSSAIKNYQSKQHKGASNYHSSSNSKATIQQPQGTPHKNLQSNSNSKAKNKMAGTLMVKTGLITQTYDMKTANWTVLTDNYEFGYLILDEKHKRLIFTLRGSIGFATTGLFKMSYRYMSGFGSYDKAAIDSEHRMLFLVGSIKGKLGSRYLVMFNTTSPKDKGKLNEIKCMDDDGLQENTQMAINADKRYLYLITNELIDEYTRKIYITTYSYSGEVVRRIPVKKKKKILCLVYDSQEDRLIFTNKDSLYKVNLKTGTVSEINLVKYPTSTIKHLVYSYGTAIIITWDRILIYDLDWKFKKEEKKKSIQIACLIPES